MQPAKFLNNTSYILVLCLTVYLLAVEYQSTAGAGAVLALNTALLAITALNLRRLLRSYFSTLSRIVLRSSIVTGLALCLLAFTGGGSAQVLSALQLVIWLAISISYWRNKTNNFIRMGHGPLQRDAAINPPAEMLEPGTLVISGGRLVRWFWQFNPGLVVRIARWIHNSVDHGELVLVDPQGNKVCFSAWMTHGVVLSPIEKILKGTTNKGDFYVAMRPANPWTEAESKAAYQHALTIMEENKIWKAQAQAQFDARLERLWLPQFLKKRLKSFRPDGYDWHGLVRGHKTQHIDHEPAPYVCIAACREVYLRNGMTLRPYANGVLGLGTGTLDPLIAARFLDEPALQLIKQEDVRLWQATRALTTTSANIVTTSTVTTDNPVQKTVKVRHKERRRSRMKKRH